MGSLKGLCVSYPPLFAPAPELEGLERRKLPNVTCSGQCLAILPLTASAGSLPPESLFCFTSLDAASFGVARVGGDPGGVSCATPRSGKASLESFYCLVSVVILEEDFP